MPASCSFVDCEFESIKSAAAYLFRSRDRRSRCPSTLSRYSGIGVPLRKARCRSNHADQALSRSLQVHRIYFPTTRSGEDRDERQARKSCRRHQSRMVHISRRVGKRSEYIIHFKIGKLRENFFVSHSVGEEFENVDNADPHSANTRSSSALCR